MAAAGLLVSACGSGDEQSSSGAPVDTETTVPVAGAQENAVTSGAVCYEWPSGTVAMPSGTVAMPCAVGLKGPGGGRVFYDAGSEQSWGRFLEVAPQNWGGKMYDCTWRISCGTTARVMPQTSDFKVSARLVNSEYKGYFPCTSADGSLLLEGEAANTLWEIGGGRRNTEVLLQAAGCVDGTESALQLVTAYRVRSGLSDWHLPSGGELTALCKYEGRNAIGGFVNQEYLSSTVGPKNDHTNFFSVDFASNPVCARTDVLRPGNISSDFYYPRAVRPIRAFSGLLAAGDQQVSVGSGNGGSGGVGEQN